MSAATPPTLKLSLCMIAKNEEANLPRCLASVQGMVDEIILVDTGSTDGTVAVAEAQGAKIFHEAWRDDFALARNASLEKATGDWILQLDADEELEPASRARLRDALNATAADGLAVCVRSFLPERALATHNDVMLVRLFRRRPGVRFEMALHEQILPSILRQKGQVLTSDLVIWHYGYAQPTVQNQDNRLQRNIRLLELELARQPKNAFLCASLGLIYQQAGREAQAEVYLSRALGLARNDLPDDMLAGIYLARATLARQRGDWAAAIQYAQAGRQWGGGGELNLLNFLGQTYCQMGEQEISAAQQVVQSQPGATLDSENQLRQGQAHLKQARLAFQQAQTVFCQLRDHPLLNPAARGEVEMVLGRCQAFLRSTAAYA